MYVKSLIETFWIKGLNDNVCLAEGLSELSGHGTVEKEVDHAVCEGEHIHQLPERGVAVPEEVVAQKTRQDSKYSL